MVFRVRHAEQKYDLDVTAASQPITQILAHRASGRTRQRVNAEPPTHYSREQPFSNRAPTNEHVLSLSSCVVNARASEHLVKCAKLDARVCSSDVVELRVE